MSEDLRFSDLQIELVKLAKERNLEPQELFTGVIIGLEQGILDLLEQTNKVTKALTEQVKRDR